MLSFIIILKEKEEKAKKKNDRRKARLDFPGTKGSMPRF